MELDWLRKKIGEGAPGLKTTSAGKECRFSVWRKMTFLNVFLRRLEGRALQRRWILDVVLRWLAQGALRLRWIVP